ncbi:MAG: ATP-binding protein [Thermoproteota archaeon]|jgi:predicted AAA+ superfamily ATPase
MYNKRLVKDYFIHEKENIQRLKIIDRELNINFAEGKATVIVGPRRAGKTFFLKSFALKQNTFFYIDFENIIFKKLSPLEIFEIISIYTETFGEKPSLLLLDEIQNLPEWQSVVRALLERNYNLLISGSSSKLLSMEIATQLRGRSLSYLLLPFSFREFLLLKKFEMKKHLTLEEEGKIKNLLIEYMEGSSYPEILITGNERILGEYYNTILYTDFVERFRLKSLDVARFVFNFFLFNFSNEFSINKIVNFLSSQGIKFGKETVYDYVEKLPETLNVFFIERYEKSAYKRKAWPRKCYICDWGLSRLLSFEKNYGKIMENIVFLEWKRKTNENPFLDITYLKLNNGEVDFVIREGLRIKQLVQVTYAHSKDELEKREIRSLLKAGEILGCKDLLIITWDYEDVLKINNSEIKCIPLWKWLLNI